jgi:hypothetical protein
VTVHCASHQELLGELDHALTHGVKKYKQQNKEPNGAGDWARSMSSISCSRVCHRPASFFMYCHCTIGGADTMMLCGRHPAKLHPRS